MIDFRYHLVSLVSVFLALAVGIVLGAGPLKEPIGATLQDNVNSLRQEKDGLRLEIGRLEASQHHRDDFIGRLSPALVGQRLAGHTVAVVTLPGVDTETVEQLTAVLERSGAKATSRIAVAEEWTDPDKAAFREQLATQLQTGAGGSETGSQIPQLLATLLARAVLTDDPATTKPDSAARTTLEGLVSGDLVAVDGDVDSRAELAVLLAPPVPENPTVGSTTVNPETRTTTWRALATALDSESDGAVVLGPPSSAGDGGLIKAVRDEARLERALSSVDTAGTPMGPMTTVLALVEQLGGGAGAYGYADGADKVLPATAGIPAED